MSTAVVPNLTRPRHLHLVPDLAPAARSGGAAPPRTRVLLALVVVVVLSLLVTVNGAARRADALDARPAVAGYAVVEPGESLWTVAVEHAPRGADPRRYLAQIQELNGLEDAAVPAWTVVLLPGTGGR